ncbi:MAG: hypothetical protein Q8L60_00450 [Gammaproteobacteria bacterium]|nr:hypothetical protein [Gammaproteobacteria bacterium]MDP2142325.1 hypothetical protein [Gammaproteobacteria bacterium]MDP2348566.1 hypothetical protein [Gammaproteobacteria bacterium]
MTRSIGQTRYRMFMPTALAVLMLAAASCSDSEMTAVSETTGPSYNTTLNMRDFMNLVLEPTADVLWESAGWINSIESGYQELYPTNDQEWDYVRRQSAVIIELGNALALPGRAVDNDAWVTYANGLSNAGILAMNAATEQNQEDFFQAGAQLYSVCTACHQGYNAEISRFASN